MKRPCAKCRRLASPADPDAVMGHIIEDHELAFEQAQAVRDRLFGFGDGRGGAD